MECALFVRQAESAGVRRIGRVFGARANPYGIAARIVLDPATAGGIFPALEFRAWNLDGVDHSDRFYCGHSTYGVTAITRHLT